MASTTTKLLHLRPKLKPFPPPPKPFSSSSSSSSNPDTENTLHQTPNTENTPTPSPKPKPFSFSSIANNNNNTQDPSSKSSSSFDEIRKNLAEFRLRAGAAAPSRPTTSPPSFQQLYKNTLNNINNNNNVDFNPNRKLPTTGKFGFDAIRANLSKLKENNNGNGQNNEYGGGGKLSDPLSLSRLKDSLQMRPAMGNDVKGGGGGGVGMVIGGGSGNLPSSIFGKEMMMRDKEGGGEKEGTKTKFVRSYNPGDLGAKLKMLKPVKKKEEEKGSFSLQELKDRLDKVRENDEKESKLMNTSGLGDLKRCLVQLMHDGDKKAKKTIFQRFEILEHLGGTPSFMLHPPKEHLVEKFFHPDHMSSGEKMKLELQKVRDEFKMSESDCGSARVQVAQLTTKIKHLSTVLHKKDKHSRKGLQEMVQKRKKLLKYLRKTDWESYCLVLSKLGLRDNPDYKF